MCRVKCVCSNLSTIFSKCLSSGRIKAFFSTLILTLTESTSYGSDFVLETLLENPHLLLVLRFWGKHVKLEFVR